MSAIRSVWRSYTYAEKRDIGIYMAGIMFYKLGLEFFNGSITTLATKRFESGQTFTKMGAAQGLNQAAQCAGAILIAPLVKRWPTRTVLSAAITMFALMAATLLIVDAGTGGKFKDHKGNGATQYGTWSPNLLFLFWTISGICYGMVELIRRVIPADIVGGQVDKLRRMDATVHIFYEIAGTGGAFASSSAISRWGDNKSFFLTPVFFTLAGVTWLFISTLSFAREGVLNEEMEAAGLAGVDRSKRPTTNYFIMVGRGFRSFGESVWVGAKLIFTNRCFIWLIPSYAIALYLHRFLENTLAPAFAKRVLGTVQWSQIIVGGSNFGELLGALSVLILSDHVPTPLPWLRFDALAAFLYTTYIVLYAVLSVVLGHVIDVDDDTHGNIIRSLRTVGGVHFTVSCFIILASTFVPRGAYSFNPKALGTITTGGSPEQSDSEMDSIVDGRKGSRDLKASTISFVLIVKTAKPCVAAII
ncbi:hypothetical protein MD484_g4859, partial [Candolleomyces efflorescens]